MNRNTLIESVLFWRGEPIDRKALGKILSISDEDVTGELSKLGETLKDRGVRLVEKDGSVSLMTAPEHSATITALTKEELECNIGKAGLQTLTIILYRGPITRSEIDYIRGVNSTFILRNLLIRGLVEKVPDEKDQRRFLYRPTFELLGFLGLEKVSDLPEYNVVQEEIRVFKESQEKAHAESEQSDADNVENNL
jgi:segregation and condensation protein B